MMDNFEPLKIRHFLITDVAGKKFAFDINEIDSIHTSRRKGDFDDMEDLKAAVRLHKRVIPIINLRRKFVLKSDTLPLFPSLLFLKSKENGKSAIIGVQVDMTLEIVEVTQHQMNTYKYGHPKIKVIANQNIEKIPVLSMNDLVSESESMLLTTEVLN